jgi:hypothetical protein
MMQSRKTTKFAPARTVLGQAMTLALVCMGYGMYGRRAEAATQVGCPVSVDTTLTTGTYYNSLSNCVLQFGVTLTNDATLKNYAGASLINDGALTNSIFRTLTNDGALTNSSTGTLTNYGQLRNYGTLTNDGTLNNHYTQVSGYDPIYGYYYISNFPASLRNDGTLINNGTVNSVQSDFHNWGTLINNGTLNADYLSNHYNATLTNNGTINGPLKSNGTATNASGGLINGSLVVIIGSTTNATGGTMNLTGLSVEYHAGFTSTLDNAGTLTLLAGGSGTNNGIVNNSGTLAIEAGATLGGSGQTTQTAGQFIVDGDVTQASVDIQGGTLSGGGTLHADVTNSGGTVGPGNSPGLLTIDGTFTQDSGGIFTAEIGGLLGGTEYDVLDVTGTAFLDGLLDVDLFDLGSGPFMPALGDSFDILTAEILSGSFNTLDLAILTGGLDWQVDYLVDAIGSTDIVRLSVVSAVPLPATVWLFGSGVLGLAGIARRKRQKAA